MPSLPDHPEQPVRFTGKVSDKIFSQYVSLRESLDSLVFTTTKQKYIDKVERQKGDPSTVLGRWVREHGEDQQSPLPDPPRNSSNETRIEIQNIIQRQADATHDEIEFARDMDDIEKVYEWFDRETFKLTGVGYGYSTLARWAARNDGMVNWLKLIYRRPRPYLVAPRIGLELNSLIGHIDTASYPSGHAADSFLVATMLGNRHPEHRKAFDGMAWKIADGRMILGVHYPSDLVAGEQLGRLAAGMLEG